MRFFQTRRKKGELRPEISLLHMKVLTLIKAKSNVFLWYIQCCSCTRGSKTKILTTRVPPSWIEFDVVTSHRQTRHLEYGLCITQSEALWVWRCDVTTSNSIQVCPSRQYFSFRSSRAATALHVSKKNITFCFNQG